jgi:hypothetical protein
MTNPQITRKQYINYTNTLLESEILFNMYRLNNLLYDRVINTINKDTKEKIIITVTNNSVEITYESGKTEMYVDDGLPKYSNDFPNIVYIKGCPFELIE